MATKKAAAKTAKVETKAKGKKVLTDEEKKAKREAMRERLKNRPEGQRPNSKQIDIIETANGKVLTYAMPVRKVGSLITVIAHDQDGNVVSTSVTLVPGVSPKSKKGHGNLVPKVPGMGKGNKGADVENDDTDEEDED